MLNVYVAFYNSTFCVEYQIKTLKTFLLDDHQLVFIDNNMGRHPDSSKKLLEIAASHDIPVITNVDSSCEELQSGIDDGSLGASDKHGWTLNLIWQHVKHTQPEYFGFLDQDCFLFKPTSMTDILDRKSAYGKVVPTHPDEIHLSKDGTPTWNLHVVANFYKTSFLLDKDLGPGSAVNFMPGVWGEMFGHERVGLDTGGMNWFSVWRHEDPLDFAMEEDHYLYYDDKSLLDPEGTHPTHVLYEIHDNRWVHMVHGANSSVSSDYLQPKTSYIKGFLDGMLLTNGSQFSVPSGYRSKWDPRNDA
tara:strand:+ start:2294 stop:3202 length:909 start_codon:yes stop_codon:yes gene_type:complete